MEFSFQQRQIWLKQLKHQTFDLVIIGGGITGAGIALEASQSGVNVLLIDKSDFASGTSSQSSKLVHGGLRYLQQYHFGLVATALRERYQLLQRAPHLIKKLSFLLPIYHDAPDGYWKLHAGLFFYDNLSFFHQIGKHRMVAQDEIKQRLSGLKTNGLKAAAHYWDAQGDDARLVLASILTAVQSGLQAINYLDCKSFNKDNRNCWVIDTIDCLTQQHYSISAKVIVNATGPWSDITRGLANGYDSQPARVRNTRGVHLLVARQKMPIDDAVMIFSPIDHRAMFAIPWEGMVLLGTTDRDYNQSLDEICATIEDVNYILESFNDAFPDSSIKQDDIISTMAGCRPLVMKKGKKHASEISREHAIFEEPQGCINIIGGKLTTYQKMAKDTLRAVLKHHGLRKKRSTKQCRLVGSQGNFQSIRQQLLTNKLLDIDVLQALIGRYGTETKQVLDLVNQQLALGERILPGYNYIWAEIDYTIQNEMVMQLDDLIMRRTRLFYLCHNHGQPVIKEIVARMANLLNWDQSVVAHQLERYEYLVQQNDFYKYFK